MIAGGPSPDRPPPCRNSNAKPCPCCKPVNPPNLIRALTVSGTCTVAGLVLISCATSSGPRSSTRLFNGRDLNGWSYVSADPKVPLDKVWAAKDGLLVCQGTPVGALYRSEQVANFRMALEYRWPAGRKPGNSGIFSRINGSLK